MKHGSSPLSDDSSKGTSSDALDPRPTILRIISRLNIGGSALHTILLTDGMASSGYRVLLVIGKEDPEEGNMIEIARQRGIEPVQIPEMRRAINPLRDLKALVRLMRLIR